MRAPELFRYNASVEELQSQGDMGWQCSLADGKSSEAKRIVGDLSPLCFHPVVTDSVHLHHPIGFSQPLVCPIMHYI